MLAPVNLAANILQIPNELDALMPVQITKRIKSAPDVTINYSTQARRVY